DGSSPSKKLLADGLNSRFGTWSPDGHRIAFVGSGATGNSGLYLIAAGPDDLLAGGLTGTPIAADIRIALSNSSNCLDHPLWSPDGTELAVTSVTSGACPQAHTDGIVIVKADGSGQRVLTSYAGNPAWSPDGKQIAFQRIVDPSEMANGRPCTVRTW